MTEARKTEKKLTEVLIQLIERDVKIIANQTSKLVEEDRWNCDYQIIINGECRNNQCSYTDLISEIVDNLYLKYYDIEFRNFEYKNRIAIHKIVDKIIDCSQGLKEAV